MVFFDVDDGGWNGEVGYGVGVWCWCGWFVGVGDG